MSKLACIVAGAFASFAVSGGAFAQQVSGQVGSGAPEDVFLELTLADDGTLTLSGTEFHLAWGGYYRFNMLCPVAGTANEASIQFMAPDLWQNSHLRLVSVSERASGDHVVGEINFHVQGLQIRNMECEGMPSVAVRFSFFPVRKGTFPFTVVNSTIDPAVEFTGSFIVE